MNVFSLLYNELLFRPLFNLLVGITDLLPTHNVGLAVILVTLLVRLVLLPSSLHQVRQAQRNQRKMAELQGELKEIQLRHKDDKVQQAQATMELYRRAGINPAAGCLPLLIQLPILLALYRVFLVGMNTDSFRFLYSFVPQPETLQLVFLMIPLDQRSILLAVLAGIGQFALMRFFTPKQMATPGTSEQSAQLMQSMQRNMTYFFPVMTVFFALNLPAALSLYWVASTFFAIAQQYLVRRFFKTEGTLPMV